MSIAEARFAGIIMKVLPSNGHDLASGSNYCDRDRVLTATESIAVAHKATQNFLETRNYIYTCDGQILEPISIDLEGIDLTR